MANTASDWTTKFLPITVFFFPQALFTCLVFELKLAPPSQVVKGSDASNLFYKLTNIQLQNETIRSKTLADEAASVHSSGRAFAYGFIMREAVVAFAKNTDSILNIWANPQSRSLKGILLLYIEPYAVGAQDSEKYVNPDITKVSVTIKLLTDRFQVCRGARFIRILCTSIKTLCKCLVEAILS